MVTSIDENGFPSYKRRDNDRYVEKIGVKWDNKYVVPYNKELVYEWCIQTWEIKYLFKSVTRVWIMYQQEEMPRKMKWLMK